MNELTVFNNPEFGEIRTITVGNTPMFCLADVCKALDITHVTDVKSRLRQDGVGINEVTDRLGRPQNAWFIDEANLYKTIFQSRKESAEKFTDWVTGEVLPSIRKNGGYIAGQEELSEQELMAKALMVAQKTIERREQEIKNLETEIEGKTKVIEELTPKATYYDVVLECPDLITTTEISKDYGMSASAFNNLLHELGIQFKQSKRWFLYTKYEGYGYTQSKTKQFTYADGSTGTKTHMYWTQKGRLFLYEFLKKKDIIPMIEKYA